MSTEDTPHLQADLIETKRALMATQAELLKAQIVGAVRLDVIRLLGCVANRREIPDLSTLLPSEPNERKMFAIELRELAADLRTRASGYDNIAASLEQG